MLCEQCGVNQASIHVTTIAGGEKSERNLCSSCMAKLQKEISPMDMSGLGGLLSGFLNIKPQQEPAVPQVQCSRCGRTYAQFQKTGLLGCAQCYTDFQEYIEPVLNKIHGHTQHMGHVPKGYEHQQNNQRMLEGLKTKLRAAIAQEEYENAAQLRDEIRALREAEDKEAAAAGGEDTHDR